MLTKFIPTTVKPSSQDIIDGWEGEGNRITAVIEDLAPSYLYVRDLYNKETNSYELDKALELALREEGPVFLIDANFNKASKVCKELSNEIDFEIECLVKQYQIDGEILIPLADDVLALIRKHAKQGTEEVAAANEKENTLGDGQMLKMMNAIGLEVGMELELQGVTAVINGFVQAHDGVQVILRVGTRKVNVPVSDVIEAKQNQLKEEVIMKTAATKGATVTLKAANTKKEEVNMTNTVQEEVITHAEVLASSTAAMDFLNATAPKAPAKEVSAPAKAPVKASNAGVSVVLAPQNNTQSEEEVKMTNTQTIVGKAPAVKAPAAPGVKAPMAPKGPSVSIKGNAGNVVAPKGSAVAAGGVLSKNAKKFTSNPNASVTSGSVRLAMKPWYLADRFENVIKDEEGVIENLVHLTLADGSEEVRFENKDLGISLVSLDMVEMFNAGKIRFLNDDYQLIVELKMANDAVVIPFQIGIYGEGYKRYENDVQYGRSVKPYPLFANNIQLVQRNGAWTGELSLSTKNEKQYAVRCACGAQNTFDSKSFKEVKEGDKHIQTVGTQKCYKCEKALTVAEVAQDAEGNALQFNSMGWIKRSLPFGFQFGEEVLAQVMAFAHVVLKEDLTHPNFK